MGTQQQVRPVMLGRAVIGIPQVAAGRRRARPMTQSPVTQSPVTQSPIRVGIVGAGIGPGRENWGVRAHLPALMALPEVEVVAICTTRLATATAAADHFGVPQAFDDAEAMVTRGDVDVVDVCVNVTAHHYLVTLALNAGKHVFCEWPLGATLEEAEDLSDHAAAAGVKHMVGLQARAAPVYDYMRQLVSDGFVGQLLSCSMSGSMAVDPSPRSESLALIHTGHCMDTLISVVGEELEEAASIVSTAPVANHVLVTGRLAGGAFVEVNIRHIPVFATGFAFEVNGSDGTLVASIDGADLQARGVRSLGEQINQASLRGGRKGEQLTDMAVPGKHRWVPDDVPSGPPFSVAQVWRRFAESIRNDTSVDLDFRLAVARHRLFSLLQRNSEKGSARLVGRPRS
jgi:predicted dehydrogenase